MAKVKFIFVMVLVVGTAVITLLAQLQTAVAQPSSQITTVLYDGSLNTGTPSTQSMDYIAFPFLIYDTFTNGVTLLDTTSSNSVYAGYFSNETAPTLSRTLGYTLHFTVQLNSEAHSSNDRAGFSVIVLSSDVKGIELGFWQNEIWEQQDDRVSLEDMFTHGEGTAWDTTSGLIAYDLAVMGDMYSLWSGDTLILNEPLRDYSNYEGQIDPYEIPNFIFLGDDTTSAQALIQLSYVAVTVTEPPVEPNSLLFLPFVAK